MGERIPLLDHTIHVERCRHGWCATVWRSSFDERGVIDGVVKIGELSSWSKIIVKHRARSLIRSVRKRGARWPSQFDTGR